MDSREKKKRGLAMNGKFLLALAFLASAVVNADQYLCTATHATGFKYSEEESGWAHDSPGIGES